MILGISSKYMLSNFLDFGISIRMRIGIKILTFPGISISFEIDQTQEKSLTRIIKKAGIVGSCCIPDLSWIQSYFLINATGAGDTSFFDTDFDTETFPMSGRFRY